MDTKPIASAMQIGVSAARHRCTLTDIRLESHRVPKSLLHFIIIILEKGKNPRGT
ncbi:MAG: hypothetical protein AAGA86_09890 [Bacteroidota bacterium]